MSKDAREWVWENSASKGNARLVMLSIADRVADEKCVAYATVPSLMERTGASRSTVRDALDMLVRCGELEEADDLQGPYRATVYWLPRAAYLIANASRPEDTPTVEPRKPDRNTPGLRRYGIRPRKGLESSPSKDQDPAPPENDTDRNPTPPGTGIQPMEGPESSPQNRSEPKVNRRYSSSATTLTSATDWEIDAETRAWAQQQGHLARLGEHGIHAADAKWRSYRAAWPPRPATAWAADWRTWIAREHSPAPSRPSLYALPGGTPAPTAGMTRAEAHTAALLAALEEPTGTE
ncbi:helix-turn-helix domain-containing protein [Streptomyces sp. GS7]|uniref:helix-turn-helix domain-containing protein n=1 Tax=Streptomyces sp. GS7 TaxID=2692234 RepID=UPI0013183829|nr:helix-turn-helix domain-containing protein [Streptomyces sp. GS7]QHC26252.1 helix-turn-helix domain-containing protein [Streptomyces sp. GS7]